MGTFQKLTRPNIKRLLAGHKLTEHGIIFERLPNGDGIYSVNIMVDRIRIHRVIGRESDGTTRTQCELFVETTRTAAREKPAITAEGSQGRNDVFRRSPALHRKAQGVWRKGNRPEGVPAQSSSQAVLRAKGSREHRVIRRRKVQEEGARSRALQRPRATVNSRC
jgi:hypothetical protein